MSAKISGETSRDNLGKPSDYAIKNILKPRPPSSKNISSQGNINIGSLPQSNENELKESLHSKKRSGSARIIPKP